MFLYLINSQLKVLKEECISMIGYTRQLLEFSSYPIMDKKLSININEYAEIKILNNKIKYIYSKLQEFKIDLEDAD